MAIYFITTFFILWIGMLFVPLASCKVFGIKMTGETLGLIITLAFVISGVGSIMILNLDSEKERNQKVLLDKSEK